MILRLISYSFELGGTTAEFFSHSLGQEASNWFRLQYFRLYPPPGAQAAHQLISGLPPKRT